SSSYPGGAATTRAPIRGEAAAAAAATDSIGRSPIGRKAFGRVAPRRLPVPAASRIAAARTSGWLMVAACQKPRGRVSAGRRLCGGLHVREDHPTRRRLQDVAHAHLDLAADE